MLTSLVRVARPVLGFSLLMAAMATVAHANPGPPPVPEIDPSAIGSAITLLASGAFLFGRKSRNA